MSELISKENLIKAIVNTPTNEQANTMQGYLDGIATRQLEIIDIINEQPTVSEQEIQDKAIEEFIDRIDKACGFYVNKNPILDREMLLRIAEQMKEVGE